METRRAWQGLAVLGLAAALCNVAGPARAARGEAGAATGRQAALCSQVRSSLTATQFQALSSQGEIAIDRNSATPPQRDLLQQLEKTVGKNAGGVRVLIRRTGASGGAPQLEIWLADGTNAPRRIQSQPLAIVCGWG